MSFRPVAPLLARQQRTGVRNTNKHAMDIINEGLNGLGTRSMFLIIRTTLPYLSAFIFLKHCVGTLNHYLEHLIDNTHLSAFSFLFSCPRLLLHSYYTPAHDVKIYLAILPCRASILVTLSHSTFSYLAVNICFLVLTCFIITAHETVIYNSSLSNEIIP